MIEELISKHADMYLEAGKAVGSLRERMLITDNFLPSIGSYVQANTVSPIADQPKAKAFKTRFKKN